MELYSQQNNIVYVKRQQYKRCLNNAKQLETSVANLKIYTGQIMKFKLYFGIFNFIRSTYIEPIRMNKVTLEICDVVILINQNKNQPIFYTQF